MTRIAPYVLAAATLCFIFAAPATSSAQSAPDKARAAAKQASDLYSKKKWSMCQQMYMQAYGHDGSHADYLYGAARCAHLGNNVPIAKQLYALFVKKAPNHSSAPYAKKLLAKLEKGASAPPPVAEPVPPKPAQTKPAQTKPAPAPGAKPAAAAKPAPAAKPAAAAKPEPVKKAESKPAAPASNTAAAKPAADVPAAKKDDATNKAVGAAAGAAAGAAVNKTASAAAKGADGGKDAAKAGAKDGASKTTAKLMGNPKTGGDAKSLDVAMTPGKGANLTKKGVGIAPKGTAKGGKKKAKKKLAAKSKRTPLHKRRFIEGELANVGASGLVPWQNRFGLVIGPQRLGQIFYLEVRPAINYTTMLGERDFTMSFALPVRLELLDTRPDRGWTSEAGRKRIGTIRAEDWDQWQDYARIIRYINFGGKEEHLYFDVNGFKASSIGHGTVMKRYNPNLNLNRRRVSAELDAFFDYGGFEIFANDITGPNIVSALAFVKPLSVIDRSNYFLRSFSVGATFTVDRQAPMRNKLDFDDADLDGKYETEIAVNQSNFNPETINTQVVSYGTSIEAKLVDTDQIDWKVYFDWSFLETGLPTDQDYMFWDKESIGTKAIRSSGKAWGNLLRLNLGKDPVHALRIRLELRQYDNNYLPSYFDTMYEIQRIQFQQHPCPTIAKGAYPLANNTKQQCVLGRNPNGEPVMGAYFEASWRASHYWAMAIGLEVNDRQGPSGLGSDNNFFFHLEMPHVGPFQWLLTYHRRSRSSIGDLFDFGGNPADEGVIGGNDIFIAKGRWRFSDMIFFNGEILTPFGIGPDSLFRNAIEINVNAEFGFGYGPNKEDD